MQPYDGLTACVAKQVIYIVAVILEKVFSKHSGAVRVAADSQVLGPVALPWSLQTYL